MENQGSKYLAATRWVSWKPPDDGSFALNTDGAVKESGCSSAGGVFPSSYGNWLKAFMVHIAYPLSSELWGLREGLKLARDTNLQQLFVKSDSNQIVTFMDHQCELGRHSNATLIMDCRAFFKQIGWHTSVEIVDLPKKELSFIYTSWVGMKARDYSIVGYLLSYLLFLVCYPLFSFSRKFDPFWSSKQASVNRPFPVFREERAHLGVRIKAYRRAFRKVNLTRPLPDFLACVLGHT